MFDRKLFMQHTNRNPINEVSGFGGNLMNQGRGTSQQRPAQQATSQQAASQQNPFYAGLDTAMQGMQQIRSLMRGQTPQQAQQPAPGSPGFVGPTRPPKKSTQSADDYLAGQGYKPEDLKTKPGLPKPGDDKRRMPSPKPKPKPGKPGVDKRPMPMPMPDKYPISPDLYKGPDSPDSPDIPAVVPPNPRLRMDLVDKRPMPVPMPKKPGFSPDVFTPIKQPRPIEQPRRGMPRGTEKEFEPRRRDIPRGTLEADPRVYQMNRLMTKLRPGLRRMY